MINNLIVHLGDTKTGSTALQSVLRSGEYITPNGQTVFYPGKKLNHNNLPISLARNKTAEYQNRVFSRVSQQLKESDADYGVISAELFQEVDPQDFKIIIETHFSEFADRVRLISYVRPHAERLVSTYSEQVKLGLISTDMKGHFENLSKRRRLHFFPRFAAWRDTFGDRFTLRFFQRDHLLNGDVVEDFFDWMFRHSGTIIQADQISNSSLTAGQVTLIWRFFDLMEANGNLSQQGRMTEFVGRALAAQFRASGLGAESEPIMIPENLAKRIQSKLRRDARKVDATFFSGNPMADALRNIPKKIIGTNKGNDATAYYSNEMLEAFDAMSQMSISLFGEGAVQAQKRVKHLLETSSQEF